MEVFYVPYRDREFRHMKKLMSLVEEENRSQVNKWGVQTHTLFRWVCFLGEEYGELCEAIAEEHFRKGKAVEIRKEAIQVATLALKIAEMIMCGEQGCRQIMGEDDGL